METVQVTRALQHRRCSAGAECKYIGAPLMGGFKTGQIAVFCPMMHFTHPECMSTNASASASANAKADRELLQVKAAGLPRFHSRSPCELLPTPCPRCRKMQSEMTTETRAVMEIARRLEMI